MLIKWASGLLIRAWYTEDYRGKDLIIAALYEVELPACHQDCMVMQFWIPQFDCDSTLKH
jgi:hypothetical protein